MAAGNTYVAIATNTLGSAAASVTFSSISAAYTDLVLVCNPTGTGTGDVSMYLNGDTSALYSRTVIDGNGTTAVSARTTGGTFIYLNYNGATTTANPNYYAINVMNYANTTTFKTILSRQSNATNAVAATVGLYRSTSAITSITVQMSANNFAIGSTFSLYGILAA